MEGPRVGEGAPEAMEAAVIHGSKYHLRSFCTASWPQSFGRIRVKRPVAYRPLAEFVVRERAGSIAVPLFSRLRDRAADAFPREKV